MAIYLLRRILSGAHDRFLRLLGQRQAIVAGSLSVEPLFPELIQPAAGMDAA
jgi:hypothetical protein